MRTELEPFLGQLISVEGWLTDWKREGNSIRYVFKNALCKEHSADIAFINQNVIGTFDHINIFVPVGKDTSFSTNEASRNKKPLERNIKVSFVGLAHNYERRNGTTDFGVFWVKQSNTNAVAFKLVKNIHKHYVGLKKDRVKFIRNNFTDDYIDKLRSKREAILKSKEILTNDKKFLCYEVDKDLIMELVDTTIERIEMMLELFQDLKKEAESNRDIRRKLTKTKKTTIFAQQTQRKTRGFA